MMEGFAQECIPIFKILLSGSDGVQKSLGILLSSSQNKLHENLLGISLRT